MANALSAPSVSGPAPSCGGYNAGALLGLWLTLAAVVAVAASNLLISRTVDYGRTQEAERTAKNWARVLASLSNEPEQLADRLQQNPKELEILRNAMRAEQVFRFKVFGPSGTLLFTSDGRNIEPSAEALSAHNAQAASVALSGGTYAKFISGVGESDRPDYYSEAYAPMLKEGQVLGVTEVYLDQSARHAAHAREATFLSITIGLLVAASIALPAVVLVHRSRQVVRAETERQMQNARFAAAVESIPQGFSMFDHENRLIACNSHYRQMYDIPDHLCVRGTPLAALVRYGEERGILPDPSAIMRSSLVYSNEPGSVTERIWQLSDGRIMAVATSPMADGGRVTIHTDITEKHKIVAQIAESEARFRDYAAAAADWCWETDAEHRFRFLTEGFQIATGLAPADVIGKTRAPAFFHPDDAPTLQILQETLAQRMPFRDLCLRVRTPHGTYASIRSNGAPRFAADGTFLGYRGTGRDVTVEEASKAELQAAQDALHQRTQLLVEAQRLGKIGNWHHALGSNHQEWSAEIFAILRMDPNTNKIDTRCMLDRCLGDGAKRILASLETAAETHEPQTVDVKVRCDDGTIRDCAVISSAAHDATGTLTGFRGTVQDITDRKKAEEQLEKLAFYDPLTGLPNRALFSRQLDSLVAQESNSGAALLLLDLDRFKDVNDSLGHASGDQLLAKVGAMIKTTLKPHHLLARIGGDEFAIIISHSESRDSIAALAGRIIDSVSGLIELAHGEVTVGASIGIACLAGDIPAAVLLRNADLALYKAKESGRGRYEFFREELNGALQHKMRLERDLRRALTENLGLSMAYQPLVDLAEGTVTGFEALVRWRHPELGPISPAEFIPIAEGSQLIIDIGRWVLRESTAQMKAWIDAGHAPREISVNVSAAQLWHSDLVGDVAGILADTGLPPHLLCLELTESLLADPSEQRVRSGLGRLKELGIQLALDDFGTDYSSLGYLTQLPFDKLKIDRIFVDGVAQSPRRRALLKGIIALGHGLGMTVVGEGAERPEEIEVLRVLGCNTAQGYVLSRPLPPQQAVIIAQDFTMPTQANEVLALQSRVLSQAG